MATVASKVPFKHICTVCEKISSKKGNELKKKVLIDFVTAWRDFHNKLHKNETQTEDSFYPAMRLLLPQFEKERGAYGIKEVTLSKLYIDILSLNKESGDAQKLLNFRNPQTSKANAGDFAMVAYYVLKNRCPPTGTLTVAEVNEDLDGVSHCHANQDKDGVKRHLKHLLCNTSAMEQKWLIRMIMKDMKFGLSEQSIFSIYHPDAKDLYDVTNNLQKVCISLRDPKIRLHEIEISMFSPFRPMLADRASPEKVENLMHSDTFYIETKHDGERMQLHKKGGEYKYFSRGGNEYTDSYGANRFGGNLTPHIADLFHSSVNECILDGEMVGYSSKTDCIGTKAENFDVKALKDGDFYHPCYYVFDILLINGKILSNLPLKMRLEYLDKTFKVKKGRLLLTNRTEGKSKQDAANALNAAIDNREEGIVIKDPNSIYRPNTRKGGWIKLKPEYVDSMMDQLDLLIIGGYFGEGHRRGMISHFLLAVAVPPKSGEEHPSEFHSITKVGSGYTMTELYEMCQKLNPHWKTYDKKNPPKSLILAPGHRERPDLWVEPSDSFIVQVKAAEFMDSNQFKTGCTLRFPRVEKVRYDKPWYQCMTTTEMEELKQLASGKLATKHYQFDDEEADGQTVKKKKKTAVEQPVTMAPQFQTIDSSSVTQISKLFEGKEFCVINGLNKSKPDLEKLIVEYGGSLVQNPGVKTFSVIADQRSLRVANLIKANLYDIVKSSWLLNCLQENRLLTRLPSNFMHMSAETASLLSETFDRFGDSYTQPVDTITLKEIFASMSPQEIGPVDVYSLEQEYFSHSIAGLFRPFDFYFDLYLIIGDTDTKFSSTSLQLIKSDSIFNGAKVSDCLHDKVTHVIVNSSHLERVNEFRRINRLRRKKFHLITERWVEESTKHSKIMNENNYNP
ncbi:DNA ligase (ATP) [Chamberlinius hualienensis]